MRVLIACEFGGGIRDAFIALGHDAVSCDILPSEVGGPHYQCDVRDVLDEGWDLMIAHPPCTYLTNSAAWAFKDKPMLLGKPRKTKPGTLIGAARRKARAEALDFIRTLMKAPVPRIAIENPVGTISTHIRPADQYIQPYEFGYDKSKLTGLWLKNLPLLVPTGPYIAPRKVDGKNRWGNQAACGADGTSPGPDRWKIRSLICDGIAQAMAEQWGSLPPLKNLVACLQ